MPKRRLVLISVWALVGYLAPSACAVSDDEPVVEGECLFGPTCGMLDSGTPPSTETRVDAASSDQVDASIQGELCGVGSCLPDDIHSCEDLVDASFDAATEAGSPDLDAGAADPQGASPPASADAASLDGGDAAGSGADAGVASGPGSAPDPGAIPADSGVSPGEIPGPMACQIAGTAEQPRRRCLPTGNAELAAPCEDSSECAAGLACAAESGQGHCLPYCCSGNEACAVGSFCSPRPALRDGHARPVPVCVPADNCALDEGFPCAGDSCVCATGTACTVVRGDGTTSCEAPGRGLDGDECPCAAGYFCSPASRTCLQICELTDTNASDCLAGHCQMAAGFPEGWGVCVGSSAPR